MLLLLLRLLLEEEEEELLQLLQLLLLLCVSWEPTTAYVLRALEAAEGMPLLLPLLALIDRALQRRLPRFENATLACRRSAFIGRQVAA